MTISVAAVKLLNNESKLYKKWSLSSLVVLSYAIFIDHVSFWAQKIKIKAQNYALIKTNPFSDIHLAKPTGTLFILHVFYICFDSDCFISSGFRSHFIQDS